jgi:hypothetical protein
MSYPVESIVTKLLPLLHRLPGDEQIRSFAAGAAESLMGLVDAGAFSMKDQPNASAELMEAIAQDPRLNGADCVVANLLIGASNKRTPHARLSYAEISQQSQFSIGAVRSSLKRLVDAGYFRVIRPSPHQIAEGDSGLSYEPQFDARLSLEMDKDAMTS